MEEGRAGMGVITRADAVPALAGGRTAVEGYDPRLHDPYFDGVNARLADKGFVVAAADDLINWA
ncbi:MAG: NADH-quinone oxidoreductase subunit B, partial [Caulobacteraceae bacterium]